MKTIAFFNNKGGVGKTSLVYHLVWIFAELGMSVLAVDLDPQANLTSMFLSEDRLEELWPDNDHPLTISGAIQPILRGKGDINDPHIESIEDRLGLIPGDLELSRFEDKLSDSWPKCHNRDEAAFRVMTAFYRLIAQASKKSGSQIILVDVGPNLGAINRSAIIACDDVVVPLAPDLFSLQGLRNLGPTLREWRTTWEDLLIKAPQAEDLLLPAGQMKPAGYVVMQHGIRETRPVKAYQRWLNRIPQVYREAVLGQKDGSAPEVVDDPHNLGLLKHYRSLMPLAMEAHKPMFYLKPADGAIGAHIEAVKSCHDDFMSLAKKIADQVGIVLN